MYMLEVVVYVVVVGESFRPVFVVANARFRPVFSSLQKGRLWLFMVGIGIECV